MLWKCVVGSDGTSARGGGSQFGATAHPEQSSQVGHMGADRRDRGVHDDRDLFVGSADSGPAQAFETARTEVWHRLIDCYRVAMEPPRFGKGLAGDPRRGPAIGGAW